MTARIIDAYKLFTLQSELRHGDSWLRRNARDALKAIALEDNDLTVASVAAKLARPVRNWTPTHNGDAA